MVHRRGFANLPQAKPTTRPQNCHGGDQMGRFVEPRGDQDQQCHEVCMDTFVYLTMQRIQRVIAVGLLQQMAPSGHPPRLMVISSPHVGLTAL